MKNFSELRPIEEDLRALLQKKILIMDGAMGTMIQQEKLVEDDFRGELFKSHKEISGELLIGKGLMQI